MKRKQTLVQNDHVSIAFKIVLFLILIVAVLPLYMVIVNLFKDSETIRMSPFSLPTKPVVDNLIYVLTDPYKNVWVLYLNTLIITLGGTVLTLLISSMLAYYVARSGKKFANFLYVYFLAALSIPVLLLYTPQAFLLRQLGLSEAGIPVMILLYTCYNVSFGMFIYTGFLRGLPMGIEEAARIDGASTWQVFFHIVFPLLKPATTTIAIFIGCAMWNDFLTPLLLGGGLETITTGIYSAIGIQSTDWGRVFAYVFVSSLPTVLFFLLTQKNFISGITLGAMKS